MFFQFVTMPTMLLFVEAMSTLIAVKAEENHELLALVLEVAGDIRLVVGRIRNGFEEHGHDYSNMSEDEAAVLHIAQNIITSPGDREMAFG